MLGASKTCRLQRSAQQSFDVEALFLIQISKDRDSVRCYNFTTMNASHSIGPETIQMTLLKDGASDLA